MPEVRTPKLALKAIKPNPTELKYMYSGREGESILVRDDFSLSKDNLPLLLTRMSTQLTKSHYEIELAVPVNGRYNWYAFHEHVEAVDLPEFFLQATDDTVIKRRIDDATNLSPEDRFNFNTSSQPLQANFIRDAGPKYFEISLIKPVNGVHNWFAYKGHVRASNVQSRTAASRR